MSAGFRISIGGDLREIATVDRALAEFSAAHGLPADLRRRLHVVLDELLANTVQHGLAGRVDGWASVDVSLDETQLVMVLRDNGTAFDPLARAAPDTTLSVDERAIGGLGVHLVRRLMDDVSYRREGEVNVVTLVKRL